MFRFPIGAARSAILLILLPLLLACMNAHAAIVGDNCATDQSAQLQAAIDSRRGNVTLPPGCIGISKPIYARSWVALRGSGKRFTTLKALPNFGGSALVILGTNRAADGPGRELVFDALFSDLTLDAGAAPAGTRCAHIAGGQEGSGLERVACVGIAGSDTDAIRISDNVNRVILRELEIYPAGPIRYGISNENAYCGCELSNITVGVSSTMTAGIRLFDATFMMNRIHCEQAANCIQVDGDNGTGVISSVDGPTVIETVGNLLFVSGASIVAAQGLTRNAYTNNVVSLFGTVVTRADPVIGQILINNDRFTPH